MRCAMERHDRHLIYTVLILGTLLFLTFMIPTLEAKDSLDAAEDHILEQLKEVRKRKAEKAEREKRLQEEKRRRAAELRRRGKGKSATIQETARTTDGAVDLGDLDSSVDTSQAHVSDPSGGGGPLFKAYFDLLLINRPGIQTFTFRNFHPIFLADYVPNSKVRFSFEVSGNPRFYELAYDVTDKLTLRLGKIAIPFDEMSPHNTFGGFMNASEHRDPAGVAFLPDIWADLGVGARYTLVEKKEITLISQIYVVNGFGTGVLDPVSGSPNYPNFGGSTTIGAADNNKDKAFGGRIQMILANVLSLGASAYWGGYMGENDESARILLVGLDTQLKMIPGTEFKAGFLYGKIGLIGASDPFFEKGGLYGELIQTLKKDWKASLRGGIVQADNRVADVNDRTVVGLKVSHDFTDFLQVSLEHHRDIKDIPGKLAKQFTGLRFVVML